MEFVRLTNPIEMFACEKQIKTLFEKYHERVKHYLEIESPELIWQKAVMTLDNFRNFPDYYFYLLRENEEFIGFVIGNLVKIPYFTVFLMSDYYIPKRGKQFSLYMKLVQQILGADSIWDECPENIFRVYRRNLKDSSVKKAQMVRINL